jgi:hypothetical protein
MKIHFVGAIILATALPGVAPTHAAAQNTEALELLCADKRLPTQEQEECRNQIRSAASEEERSRVIQALNAKLNRMPPTTGGPDAGSSSTAGGTDKRPNK